RERVAPVIGGTACGLEVDGRPARQWARLDFGGPQFAQIADRLLEVVAEDLRAFGRRSPEAVLEPVGEAVVQLGARRFGDRPVSRFLDQYVAEAVLIGGPPVGWIVLHQPLRDEGLQVAAERVACLRR